jgi:hypothetical protein
MIAAIALIIAPVLNASTKVMEPELKFRFCFMAISKQITGIIIEKRVI